ncbi:hypothetical protein ACLM5H_20240 [Fredinandcohnia humi]
MKLKKYDKFIAILFVILTISFIVLAFSNRDFLDWAFARHHNQLSWYIRPVFLIPFCYFAFKRSSAGISITIFALLTSMFWFPEPDSVSKQVQDFLQYEVEYLTGDWYLAKILVTLLIPISLILLGMAFWKRNLWVGLLVLLFIALGKILWSIQSAGESGKSIVVPAIVGLVFCITLVYWGFKKLSKKSNESISK